MHEHGIADHVYRALTEEMRRRGATRVVSATVHVGEFSGITEEVLRDGLKHCAEHEGVEPFEVTVIVEGPRARCTQCGAEEPLGDRMACGACGSEGIEVVPATGVVIGEVEFA